MKNSKDSKKKAGMFGATPPNAGAEKKKILVMSGALLVLLVAFLFNQTKSSRPDVDVPMSGIGGQDGEVAEVVDIQIPAQRSAELGKLVKDGTRSERATLEAEAVELALDDAARLAAPHYDAMATRVANETVVRELEASPKTARLSPLRLRGYVLSMTVRERANGQPYRAGTIILDDGTPAHYLVSKLAEDKLNVGSAVRLDGLFVKNFSEEVDGTWLDGPLVAGREMVRSFPALYTAEGDLGPFTETELAHIVNDDIETGVGTLPFEEKWKLMARAANVQAEDIDWNSVPMLDAATLRDILMDGDKWRGQPIRLPADGAALMTSSVRPAGENPARLETYTEGWLADNSWLNLAPAIQFLAPFGKQIPDEADPTVLGRGFLFKNLAYRSSGTGVRLTPVLVLSQLEPLPRPSERILGYLLGIVILISVVLGTGIFILLRRDKKRSEEFQRQRSLRRRSRKEGTPSAS